MNRPAGSRIGLLALAVLAGVLAAAFLMRFIQAPLVHDEQHYVAAGVLVRGAALYRDIPYFQTPYLPYLYHAVNRVAGDGGFLLKARLATFFLLVVGTGFLAATLVRLSGSAGVARDLLLLVAGSGVLLGAAGHADNNIPAMAFLCAGGYFFVRGTGGEGGRPGFALAGILLAAAGWIKAFYLPLLLPFAVWAWLYGRGACGALLAGAAAGSLPAMMIAAAAPADFLFDNVTYHRLTSAWWAAKGQGALVLWRSNAHFLKRTFLLAPANLLLTAGTALMILGAGRRFRCPGGAPGAGAAMLATAVLAGGGGVLLLVPRPLYLQHMVLLLPLLCWAAAAGFRNLSETQKILLGRVLTGFCLISWLVQGPAVLAPLGRPFLSTPEAVAAEGRRLRALLPGPGTVATLTPLTALEAGLPVCRELATGPFLYRLGASGPAEQIMARCVPAAVLTGGEPELDGDWERAASGAGFRTLLFPGGQLWVRSIDRGAS